MWADAEPEDANTSEPPVGWWTRRWLRAEAWPLVLAAIVLMLAHFCWYTSPTVAMVALNYYGDFCYGVVLFGVLAAARGVQLLVARRCAARHGFESQAIHSGRRFWLWFAAIIGVTFVAVREEVPMHAGFHLSRPWLDANADEALANPANAHRLVGRWAGGYRIAGVEVIGETVVLYIDRSEGCYGFARVPGAKSNHIYNVPGGHDIPHNHREFPPNRGGADPVGERLSGDWFVVYSAYWRVKVGPS
jgi:hypothetical protein